MTFKKTQTEPVLRQANSLRSLLAGMEFAPYLFLPTHLPFLQGGVFCISSAWLGPRGRSRGTAGAGGSRPARRLTLPLLPLPPTSQPLLYYIL